MLCCIGLYSGLAVGRSIGGQWTVIAPAIGFGLGLYGDMKLMRGVHRHGKDSSDWVDMIPMPNCTVCGQSFSDDIRFLNHMMEKHGFRNPNVGKPDRNSRGY